MPTDTQGSRSPITCRRCAQVMNFHAEKFVEWAGEDQDGMAAGSTCEIHTCPGCGNSAIRVASEQAGQC